MAIQNAVLTDEQRDRLMSISEGHFADAKAIEIGPAKLSRSISAFANADGGELYIGLPEKSKGVFGWKGFASEEAANSHLQVLGDLFPLGGDFAYTFLSHPSQSGTVLQIAVHKTRAIVKASNGIPYVRRGAQNLPVTSAEALKILERNKGLTSFENETVPTKLEAVTNSETVVGFMLEVIPTAEPEPWLRKQQLITDDKPTVAGVILFADLPQALLPKRSGVKLYRYKTAALAGTRETLVGNPVSIEGSAYELIREAVKRTQEMINQLQVLGPEGLLAIAYPPETLHEVITNAVLHRDYSIADDVHIRVFDTRIEVESPGRLPAHITVENILDQRFARNGNLVRVINKFPDAPNKDVGEGLNTAFAAMRRLKLKDPVIEELPNSLVVRIKHERLASAEELVLEHLASNDTVTNAVGRELTGIESENAMKNVFYRLRKRGLIEQVPELKGRRAAWRLASKNKRAAPSQLEIDGLPV